MLALLSRDALSRDDGGDNNDDDDGIDDPRQAGPRWLQEGLNTAQHGLKTAQEVLKAAQESSNRTLWRPRRRPNH